MLMNFLTLSFIVSCRASSFCKFGGVLFIPGTAQRSLVLSESQIASLM